MYKSGTAGRFRYPFDATKRKKRTPKRTTNAPKPRYRVRNGAQYDRALVQRAALTRWSADDLPNHGRPPATPKKGAPQRYSDYAIAGMLTLREVYQLTNRAAEGLMRSLFQLAQVDLPVPDHTTLSRRGRKVSVRLPKRSREEPLHLARDSSGLTVYGEGEWQVRQGVSAAHLAHGSLGSGLRERSGDGGGGDRGAGSRQHGRRSLTGSGGVSVGVCGSGWGV